MTTTPWKRPQKALFIASPCLDISQQAYIAAEHRYSVGVGNILELLNTRTTLASAKERRIQTLTDWDNARIDLASKLGRLDLSSISTFTPERQNLHGR